MHIAERVICVILERSCPNVAMLIPIPFQDTINRRDHHVMPYVKFSSLVKEGLLDVALDNIGFKISIVMPLFAL